MTAIENALLGDAVRQINEHAQVVNMPADTQVYGVLVYEPMAFPREQAIAVLDGAVDWMEG